MEPPPGAPRLSSTSRLARLDAWLSVHGWTTLPFGAWIIACLTLWWFGAVREFTRGHAHDGGDLWQRWPITFARAGGFVLNFNMQLVLLVACKGALRTARSMPGVAAVLPLDRLMPLFHAILGWVITVSGTLHGINHLVAGLTPGSGILGWKAGWGQWTHAAVSGVATLLALWGLVVASLPAVRRRCYEAFWWPHQALAALFVALLLLHGLLDMKLYTYKWITPLILVYLVDRGWRVWGTTAVSVQVAVGGPADAAVQGGASITRVTPDLLRLVLPRPWAFCAGQAAELNVPAVRRYQWHPYTMASSPNEADAVFLIGIRGGWSRSLGDWVDAAPPKSTLTVRLRGPYGTPAQHAELFDRVLLVGAGIGVTPMISLARSHHAERTCKGGVDASAQADKLATSWSPAVPAALARCPWTSDGECSSYSPSSTEHASTATPTWPSPVGACCPATAAAAGGAPTRIAAAIEGTLDSATATIAALWVLLLRLALVGIATPLHTVVLLRTTALTPFTVTGLVAADLCLTTVYGLHGVGLTAARLVGGTARGADLAAAAAAVANSVPPVLALAGVTTAHPTPYGLLHLAVVLPLTAVVFGWRAAETLRARVLRSPHGTARAGRAAAVDLITVVPEDDEWVAAELRGVSHTSVTHHRYVTLRAARDADDVESGGRPPSPPLVAPPVAAANGVGGDAGGPPASGSWWAKDVGDAAAPAVGRPPLGALLRSVAAETPSLTTVGVFFCGPRPMRVDLIAAAAAATAASHDAGNGGGGAAKGAPPCPPCGRDIRFLVRAEQF